MVFADYMYQDIYQGSFNFSTGAVGSSANNTFHSQGFMIGNAINF